jgi:guanine nucleotide-binding protein G(i) subunit alpha
MRRGIVSRPANECVAIKSVKMSCCKKKTEAEITSAAIDKQLKAYNKEESQEVKLLLLGPGDSGKSTLVKQVKILHIDGFTELERLSYRPIIYSNIVFNIKALCAAANQFDYKLHKSARVQFFVLE